MLVGFAAETDDVVGNARKKLEAKNLDLVVANDVTAAGAGFAGETNAVVLLRRDGERVDVPLGSKREVAERILDEVLALRAPQVIGVSSGKAAPRDRASERDETLADLLAHGRFLAG